MSKLHEIGRIVRCNRVDQWPFPPRNIERGFFRDSDQLRAQSAPLLFVHGPLHGRQDNFVANRSSANSARCIGYWQLIEIKPIVAERAVERMSYLDVREVQKQGVQRSGVLKIPERGLILSGLFHAKPRDIR